MQFEWDAEKAKSNLKKHGVDFNEAETVFSNSLAKIVDDEKHSVEEKREIIIGHSTYNRLLFVCFAEPESNRIRIISARTPTPQERKDYEEDADF